MTDVRSRRRLIAAMALALALAACSGSDESNADQDQGAVSVTTTSTTAVSTTTTASTASGSPPTTATGEDPAVVPSLIEISNELGIAVIVVEPTTETGSHPTMSWQPVDGATSYWLVVRDADERPYWAWTGNDTSVRVGGGDNPDTNQTAVVHEAMTWSVAALDGQGHLIAISDWASLSAQRNACLADTSGFDGVATASTPALASPDDGVAIEAHNLPESLQGWRTSCAPPIAASPAEGSTRDSEGHGTYPDTPEIAYDLVERGLAGQWEDLRGGGTVVE